MVVSRERWTVNLLVSQQAFFTEKVFTFHSRKRPGVTINTNKVSVVLYCPSKPLTVWRRASMNKTPSELWAHPQRQHFSWKLIFKSLFESSHRKKKCLFQLLNVIIFSVIRFYFTKVIGVLAGVWKVFGGLFHIKAATNEFNSIFLFLIH